MVKYNDILQEFLNSGRVGINIYAETYKDTTNPLIQFLADLSHSSEFYHAWEIIGVYLYSEQGYENTLTRNQRLTEQVLDYIYECVREGRI